MTSTQHPATQHPATQHPATQHPTLRVSDCGDAAVRVTAIGGSPDQQWRAVHHLADVLTGAGITGLYGVVPTYESVLIEFDAVDTDHQAVTRVVSQVAEELAHADPAPPVARTFLVPVVYGGSFGPDLEFVAEHLDTTVGAVVEMHTAHPLTIRCLGAPAGSPMMDGPAFARPIPRLRTPRTKAPAGAVSVAGTQAVIAPAASPGGWQIIGRTPLTLLDLEREPFVSYRPGDAVQFFAIPESRWVEFAGRTMEPDHA